VRLEPIPVRAERVRLDELRARPDVLTVDRLDERRIGQVQEIERAVEWNSTLVEIRPHLPVGEDDSMFEAFEERVFVGHGCRLT